MNKPNFLLAVTFGAMTLLGANLATAQEYLYVTDYTGTGGTGDGLTVINPSVPGGAVTTITSSLLDNPTGIALDTAAGQYDGDLFIASPGNDSIVDYDPTTGVFQTYSINASLGSAEGLAFDSNGNLYVANSPSPTAGNILELASGSTMPTSYTTLNSLGGPQGITVDSNGNLFVTVTMAGSNAAPGTGSQIVEITPGGVIHAFYPGGATPTNPSLTAPVGIAFNPLPTSGNIYVSDSGSNTVSLVTLFPRGSTGVAAGQNLADPHGLIFDSGGNLFVANYGADTVTEYTASTGSAGVYTYDTTFSGGGLDDPDFIAIDSKGLPIPEPSTYALLLGGLATLFFLHRRRSAVLAKA